MGGRSFLKHQERLRNQKSLSKAAYLRGFTVSGIAENSARRHIRIEYKGEYLSLTVPQTCLRPDAKTPRLQ